MAVNSNLIDTELRVRVDGVMRNYDEIFQLKLIGTNSDVFHMLSGMYKSPVKKGVSCGWVDSGPPIFSRYFYIWYINLGELQKAKLLTINHDTDDVDELNMRVKELINDHIICSGSNRLLSEHRVDFKSFSLHLQHNELYQMFAKSGKHPCKFS